MACSLSTRKEVWTETFVTRLEGAILFLFGKYGRWLHLVFVLLVWVAAETYSVSR